MATGSSETKENPSKDLMMKMTGPKSQSSSNVSSSPSTMYQTSNGGYQSLDDSMKETCHEYEDLEFRFSLCQSEKSKAKDPQSSFRKKFCSGQNNININWISICFGLISIVAIMALLLNVLLLTGGIGPKCGCNRKQDLSLSRGEKETTRTQMELTNIGVLNKTNDPMSVPLATSSPEEGLDVTGTSHESTKFDNLKKQDVNFYSPRYNILRKNTNTIYPHNGTTKLKASTQGKQKTQTTVEWWENLNKDSRALMLALGFILIISLTSLFLVVLDVVGVVGPKCVHNSKLENAKQSHNFIWPNESTTFLLERIDVLEKNISSLVLQIRSLQSRGNGVSEGNISSSGSGGNGGKDYSSNTSSLTIEVQKLREKQVQLNSSLTKLKESDKTKTKDIQEMKAKVVGLAVAVNFLSLNDSFINSKVHKSEVEFRSSIEALKQKDHVVDASIKRAKGVEALLNSSVSQLNIRLDQINTNIMAKIKSMNGTISGMQGGGAGLPGPPGPPGPRGIPGTPGAGNLSQCQHQQKEHSARSSSSADFFISYIETKDKIVVGASCSTAGGDETSLSSATNSRGEKVYICTCRGQSNYARGSGNTKCLIDVWVCPRIS